MVSKILESESEYSRFEEKDSNPNRIRIYSIISDAETTTDLNFKEEECLNGFGSPPQECINNETEEPVVIQIKKSEKFVSENQFTFNELMERKKHYPFMHFEPDPNDPQRSLCKI